MKPVERRKHARDLARTINLMLGEGLSTDDISAALGLMPRRVRRIADRHGIDMPDRETKRFSFRCPRRRSQAVIALADEAGVSVGVMLDRIVSAIVDEGPDRARRKLGKLVQRPRGRSLPDA